MRLALFSAFYPYRGGIAQFSALLFRALEKEHDVAAFTFKRQYPDFLFPGSSQFVSEKDVADRIPAQRALDAMNPLTASRAAKEINAFQPEVFVAQFWMPFFGPALGRLTKKVSKSTKKIAILHNVVPHEKRPFDKALTNYFLNKFDGFVVMSDVVLNDLKALKPQAKVLRMDHPVYDQFGAILKREAALQYLKLDSDKKYLLFFGFIRDYKGLDLLIAAISQLGPEIHLIVAGEVYGSFEAYTAQIDASPAKERIHLYTRYIADDEVSYFFSAADACVLPYKSATQSGIIAIADHFEVPVIATDVGGLKENVHHEHSGLIVPEADPEQIAHAVEYFFKSNLSASFKANIRVNSEKKSWDNFAKALVEFSKTV